MPVQDGETLKEEREISVCTG